MKLKHLFMSVLAFAGILAVASCQQDDFVGGEVTGDYVDATFTVATPDGISTRAIGDGETVNKLACAVYDADGVELPDLYKIVDINGKTATYSTRLAKGQAYHVVFFAYNGKNDGTSDYYNVEDLKNVEVLGNQLSNVEERDAFTRAYHISAEESMNAISKEIYLKRPLAQLNIGIDADEKNAAKEAGIVIKQSYVKVSSVYTCYNAFDSTVVGVSTPVEFKMATIPDATFTVDGKEYHYLALNYLLVGDLGSEKTLTDVEFQWTSANGKTNEPTTSFININTQRNYRTNIIGKLITNPTEFTVKIDERFDGEKDMNSINSIMDLQAAIDAVNAGETATFYLGANLEGNIVELQKTDRHITIDGLGHKWNGSIRIHNGSDYNNGSITIKNINFETSTESLNFIDALEYGSERYSNNITVDGCTFTATGAAQHTAAGVNAKASKNLKVLNCTANYMHSLLQAQSCDENVEVVNATINNGKNGVAFKQVKNALVEGSTINTVAYGIRFDGNTDNYGITVKNNNVTSSQPFIVRKMTGANNTIALDGNNTLTVAASSIATEAPAYQIVITKGSDDEAYSEPTGTYTLTGADDFVVYPRDVFVSTWAEFTAALAANKASFLLTEDITYDANYQLQKDVVINLNGKSMTLPMINIHTKTTIKNGTINGKVYARNNSEIVFNNVKFSGAVADNLSTEGHLAIQGGCKSLYAKDCLFSPTSVSGSQTKPLSFEGGSTIMKFEGCEFKSSPYKKQVYLNSLSATGSLNFTNCNFNNKTPNIMFAAACPLSNVTMSGTTKVSNVTFEINRAKEAVTEADWAHISSLIANNSFSSVRIFYNSTTSEYIRN